MHIKNNISISLIYDNESSLDYYNEILASFNLILRKTSHIKEVKKLELLNVDLLIIDLDSKFSLKKIDSFVFNTNTKIILIVPFHNKYLKLSENFKRNLYHIFSKPLNIDTFHKVLNSAKVQKDISDKEDLLMDFINNCPFKIAIYDIKGYLYYSNDKYVDLNTLNLSTKNIHFNRVSNSNVNFKNVITNLQSKINYVVEEKIKSKWYESYFYYVKNKSFIAHILFDINHKKLKMESLKKSSLFFHKTSEGVTITDKKGVVIAINEAFSKITGFTKEEIIGKSTNILSSGIHEKSFYKNMWNNLKYQGKWQGEIWNRRKNGEVYPEWLSITKIKDNLSQNINYIALFTDISSIKEADKKLHFYAKHDHLTGLLNRTQFENMLNYSIERCERNNKKFALMYIDLDRFKEINDTYGHNFGDLMLKKTSSRLLDTLRKEDIISRVGGDEFNVIIENIKDDVDALAIAEKLNKKINEKMTINNVVFHPSFSIGIALYPNHGKNSEDLIKNADAAMYEVKKNGRNSAMLYNKEFTDSLKKKLEIQTKLRIALKKNLLEVFYQPIIDLKNDSIIGAEALVRWFDKDLGFISPEIFIPIAEDHGMIYEIGQYVLRKSFEDLLFVLNNIDSNFKFSINVSSRELFKDDYIQNIKDLIKDFHINPKNIELEITETYVMKNYELAIQKIQELKDLGFNFSIDDFGTGYSSLNYLKTFPIDKLKIDKSFILDILKDKDDALIVETIINMAQIFKYEVQAEGIESQEHEKVLKSLGCNKAQGYHYAKPMPLNDFLTYIREKSPQNNSKI